MATIANQITRISTARDLLRAKGIELGLVVPIGSYWDDSAKKEVSTSAEALLKSTDQIDKIAAAFGTVNLYPQSEINVPILLTKNGNAVVSTTTALQPGFYSGAVIKPFITVESAEDFVIDVQTKTVTLKAKTGTLTPDEGYNYLDSVSYSIQDGAISNANDGYDNSTVTAKVTTAGWLASGTTQKISVPTSTIKVGSGAASNVETVTVTPSATADVDVVVSTGIHYGSRTIKVLSVSSQTDGNAVAADILSGKTAWVNGVKVTGNMTNYSGELAAISELVNNDGKLAVKPSETGYYTNTSVLTTDIVCNPARVFNTTNNSASVTDTMTSQIYYETIPAGYYATALTRKVTVQDAVASIAIDYANKKARLNVPAAGWLDAGDVVDVDINAASGSYATKTTDANQYTVAADDNAYLTQVTIDNSAIYNALSVI